MPTKNRIEFVLLAAGVALLSINLIGLRQSLRNPEIYSEQIPEGFDITLSEEELLSAFHSDDANRQDYLVNVTRSINSGIAHYWSDEGIGKYNLRVPISENYLLHLASYIYPRLYRKYEFTDFRKAIERGVGLCSQHSMIAVEVLREKNIPSNIVMLDGHVVLRANVSEQENSWWILDPDYGVSIPHDISEIEQDPGLVRQYYLSAGFDELTTDALVDIYGASGNVVASGIGARSYSPKTWIVERLSYVFIWVIPIFLALPASYRMTRKFRRRPRTAAQVKV